MRTKPRNLKYKATLRGRVEADSIEIKTITDTQLDDAEIAIVTKSKTKSQNSNNKDLPIIELDEVEYRPSKIIKAGIKDNSELDITKQENPEFVEIESHHMSIDTNYMNTDVFYPIKYKNGTYAIKKNSKGIIEFAEIIQRKHTEVKSKSKIVKSKTTKTKDKTPCKYCEKLFVYADKHEKNCKKNPNIVTSYNTNEPITRRIRA